MNEAVQVRITFQEWGESGLDPPVNFSLRQMLSEQTQDRKRKHDIAKRAGLQDENLHGTVK